MEKGTEKEFRKALSRIREIAEENNRILHKMRRGIIWGRIFTVFYWLVIIGATIGAYYFIQPVIQPFVDTARELIPGLQQIDAGELLQSSGVERLQNIQNQ